VDQKWLIILFVAACGIALLVLSAAIRYGFRYGIKIRRMKMEIRRAQSPMERNRWQRELRALWMSVILGIDEEKARRICKKARH
jgi:hypothetical protein